MSEKDLQELAVRIRQELEEIRRVLPRINEGWERARRSNDDYYLLTQVCSSLRAART